MLWLTGSLEEECELKLMTDIYEMHGRGLSYDMIQWILAEVVLKNLHTMVYAETALQENGDA